MDRQAQLEQKAQQRFVTNLITGFAVLCIVLIAGGVGWHYFYGPCGVTRVQTASEKLTDQNQAFDDAYNIASSTSRIALAQPVAELQSILRETEIVPVPACMEVAKTELTLSMDAAVKGFLAFMADESDSEIGALFDVSVDHLMRFSDEMLAVDDCKPFCPVE
jgi:hypothetical protein